jgi:probable F420-dependent oxidoreductase
MSIIPMQRRLGRIGIWAVELRFGNGSEVVEAAAELDDLGFGAIWIPGGAGGDLLADMDRLLSATHKAVIGSGILNIWKHQPQEVAAWWHQQPSDRQERILLGLGVSHGPLIGDSYRQPLAAMRNFLQQLATAGVPSNALCLAALGPKMLQLARESTAGAHPYLVPPEHSAVAREILGPDALLAPEQGVVLDDDRARARQICRETIEQYRRFPNYVNNWRRLGFTDDDIAQASDRLIEALFACGNAQKVAERVDAHRAAGADHVCLQVITGSPRPDVTAARAAWRKLAATSALA